MSGKYVKLRRLLLALALLPLLGCSFTSLLAAPQPQMASQPEIDANAIRTQAVETNVAYITQVAELNPSATIVPTRTRRPPTSTPTATATSTNTPFKSATITATRTNPPVPTRTPTYYILDSARLYAQAPEDFSVLTAGQDFDIIWTVRNTGSRVWSTHYAYEYSEGVKGYRKDKYYLPKPVNRLYETKLIVDMIAPKEPGTYTARWVLVNDQGIAFATFYFTFFVRAK